MVSTLKILAPAKINLYLKITGRRADGYHELNMLMQKLALYDQLELTLVSEPVIYLSCPGTDLPVNAENIVYRAARLFLDRLGKRDQGIHIVLNKEIPVAAGLGGGSSDAAAVLLALDKLLITRCTADTLAAMVLELGADVPFFIFSGAAAWATGIGEKLEPAVSLSGYRVLLVNPGISVSTKWAYETFALTSGGNIFNLNSSQKEQSLDRLGDNFWQRPFHPDTLINDLETVTAEKFSLIKRIEQDLRAFGAVGSMMSGSGPTVFGLFSSDVDQQAEQCFREFKKEYDQVYLVDPLA
jgi:4-diphosphocytidyl-2-C-methyl-D-erythritol kinase